MGVVRHFPRLRATVATLPNTEAGGRSSTILRRQLTAPLRLGNEESEMESSMFEGFWFRLIIVLVVAGILIGFLLAKFL